MKPRMEEQEAGKNFDALAEQVDKQGSVVVTRKDTNKSDLVVISSTQLEELVTELRELADLKETQGIHKRLQDLADRLEPQGIHKRL